MRLRRTSEHVYGPGIDNFNLAALKDGQLTESKSLPFRLETFNALNHAQFYGPAAVTDDVTSPEFGRIGSAAAPRLAAKSSF